MLNLSLFAEAVPTLPGPQNVIPKNNTLTAQIAEGDWNAVQDTIVTAITGWGPKVLLALIVLMIMWTAAGWVSSTVKRALTKAKFDQTLTKFLAKLSRWSVLALGFSSCASTIGVNTTSIAALIGAASLAIGLAFQGTLSNFASGAMLLIFRPFKVGDVVNLAGYTGVVDEIELFTTALDTFDNRRVIIPNSSIYGSVIENITYHERRRVDVVVGTAYEADIDRTREALLVAARSVPGVLMDPAPNVVLTSLGASSVDWSVRVWSNTQDYAAVKEAVTRMVKLALDQVGIGIPYPQMDLHIINSGENDEQSAAA